MALERYMVNSWGGPPAVVIPVNPMGSVVLSPQQRNARAMFLGWSAFLRG